MISLSRSAGTRGRVTLPRQDARYHGDQVAAPGMLDFTVDVRAVGPPSWLVERLATRLDDLGRYPGNDDRRRAAAAVGSWHGRHPDEVREVIQ